MEPAAEAAGYSERGCRVPCAETYHLTWTCYGQWLHGDERGYVDRKHRTPGEPYPEGNLQYYNAASNRMTEAACWLTDDERRIASRALREACDFRGWVLWAVNVQPDHVHVLVEARETSGKRARQVLKDRATRGLEAEGRRRQHWWTEGGKVDVIRRERQLQEVLDYINERQPFARIDERECPAASAAGSDKEEHLHPKEGEAQ